MKTLEMWGFLLNPAESYQIFKNRSQKAQAADMNGDTQASSSNVCVTNGFTL